MSHWKPYVIRPGDYLTALAAARGVDPAEIWEDSRNAELKKLRPNPEILAPDDLLYLPTPSPKPAPTAPGTTTRTTAKLPTVIIHLKLTGANGKALANQTLRIIGGTNPISKTDGAGAAEIEVSVGTPFLTVFASPSGASFKVLIGHLDPHDTDSGALARLRQLGYIGDEEPWLGEGRDGYAPKEQERAAQLRAGIGAFQQANGLKITETLDAATQAELLRQYGA